ncbi:MAG: UvrB/UvrC motif-containing protein, partial [Spirochaeta sp.]|nr:UvrB/UvrC motif-containing protein [Spirochaeta sp.]
ITPQSVNKAIADIIIRRKSEKQAIEKKDLAILAGSYNLMLPKERKAYIKELERRMLEHAKSLEFEEAAVIRDEIELLKDSGASQPPSQQKPSLRAGAQEDQGNRYE